MHICKYVAGLFPVMVIVVIQVFLMSH